MMLISLSPTLYSSSLLLVRFFIIIIIIGDCTRIRDTFGIGGIGDNPRVDPIGYGSLEERRKTTAIHASLLFGVYWKRV